jgi:hypothetical protein
MPITQQPIVEFQCGVCKQPVRVRGPAHAVCCGQRYYLEVVIHQQSQAEYETWAAEVARQLAAGKAGHTVPFPALPAEQRYPTL